MAERKAKFTPIANLISMLLLRIENEEILSEVLLHILRRELYMNAENVIDWDELEHILLQSRHFVSDRTTRTLLEQLKEEQKKFLKVHGVMEWVTSAATSKHDLTTQIFSVILKEIWSPASASEIAPEMASASSPVVNVDMRALATPAIGGILKVVSKDQEGLQYSLVFCKDVVLTLSSGASLAKHIGDEVVLSYATPVDKSEVIKLQMYTPTQKQEHLSEAQTVLTDEERCESGDYYDPAVDEYLLYDTEEEQLASRITRLPGYEAMPEMTTAVTLLHLKEKKGETEGMNVLISALDNKLVQLEIVDKHSLEKYSASDFEKLWIGFYLKSKKEKKDLHEVVDECESEGYYYEEEDPEYDDYYDE